ncbi:20898_t:CDS:2, partial [Racocetra persica]
SGSLANSPPRQGPQKPAARQKRRCRQYLNQPQSKSPTRKINSPLRMRKTRKTLLGFCSIKFL